MGAASGAAVWRRGATAEVTAVAAFAAEAAATGVVGTATAKAGVATGDETLRSSGASPREAAASSVKSRRTGRTGAFSGTVGAGDGAAVGVVTAGIAVGMITAPIDLVVLDPPSLLLPSPPSAGERVRVRGSADRRAPPLASSALSLTLSRGRERGSEAAGGAPTTVGENRTGAAPTPAVATALPATIVVGMLAAEAAKSAVLGGAASTCEDLGAIAGCGSIAGCSRE
jgi:hypothetical protein